MIQLFRYIYESESEVAQSRPAICNCTSPGSSVHGILQARILEWVAISFSRESSQSRDRIQSALQADSLLSEPQEHIYIYIYILSHGFQDGSVVKNLPANAGDTGSIPGAGHSSGGGSSNRLQYLCLGNPLDRGAWQATVHGVTKRQPPGDQVHPFSYSLPRWFITEY